VDAKRATRLSAEIGRQSIDGAERAMTTAAGALAGASASSARGLEVSVRQMEQVAQQATQGLAAMAEYRAAATAAMHEGAQAWVGWAQESVAANVSSFQALLGCRSAPEIAAVQSRLVQEQISLLVAGSRRLSEAATRTSAQAIQAMSTRTPQNPA
jgi:hypothetical protein